MLNVHELERAWLRYKIRYYMPIGIATITVIFLSIGALVFWPDNKTSELSQKTAVQPIPSEAAKTNQQPITATSPEMPMQSVQRSPETSIERKVGPQQTTSEHIAPTNTAIAATMQPSMGFMQKLESDVMPYYEEESGIKAMVPTNTVQEVVIEDAVGVNPAVTMTAPAATTQSKPQVISEEKKISKVTITQKDSEDLNDIIKRFKTNKNPALSLFLARRYYDLGAYDNAYEYALKTNEIDSEIEESWLIFAKSLVKLGKKEQALKTLKSYINHSRSLSAKNLYEEIQKGAFK